MAIIASVVNGVLQYDYTDSNAKDTSTLGSTNLGYDQFLQLLCAEMQYQDPLEPTSNTDYIAQLATFSQLEATLTQTDSIEQQTEEMKQNSQSQQLNLANALVGKNVILSLEDDSYVTGKVDYIMYDEGEIYLAVNDKLYSISTLDTVADSAYYDAVTLSNTFKEMLTTLPSVDNLDISYRVMVEQLVEVYEGMSSYEQEFVSADTVTTLRKYQTKMQALVAAAEEAEGPEVVNDETDTTDETTIV